MVDAKRFWLFTDPELIEPIRVSGLEDPQIMETVRNLKGNNYGDLMYVVESRHTTIEEVKRKALKLPEGLVITEYYFSIVLRWDRHGWKPIMPHRPGRRTPF